MLAKCGICIRHQGGTCKVKPVALWLKIQWSNHPLLPTDFFGPLYVKNRTAYNKAWVGLFTCIAVTALHLKYVEDITAAQHLACLGEYVARWGKPDKIISNNPPQFEVVMNSTNITEESVAKYPDVTSHVDNVELSGQECYQYYRGKFYQISWCYQSCWQCGHSSFSSFRGWKGSTKDLLVLRNYIEKKHRKAEFDKLLTSNNPDQNWSCHKRKNLWLASTATYKITEI